MCDGKSEQVRTTLWLQEFSGPVWWRFAPSTRNTGIRVPAFCTEGLFSPCKGRKLKQLFTTDSAHSNGSVVYSNRHHHRNDNSSISTLPGPKSSGREAKGKKSDPLTQSANGNPVSSECRPELLSLSQICQLPSCPHRHLISDFWIRTAWMEKMHKKSYKVRNTQEKLWCKNTLLGPLVKSQFNNPPVQRYFNQQHWMRTFTAKGRKWGSASGAGRSADCGRLWKLKLYSQGGNSMHHNHVLLTVTKRNTFCNTGISLCQPRSKWKVWRLSWPPESERHSKHSSHSKNLSALQMDVKAFQENKYDTKLKDSETRKGNSDHNNTSTN